MTRMLRCAVARYDMVKCDVMCYGILFDDTVCSGVVWHGRVWYDVLRCSFLWYGVLWCGMTWYSVMWCVTVFLLRIWCAGVWYDMLKCDVMYCGVPSHDMVCWGVVWHGKVWCDVLWCSFFMMTCGALWESKVCLSLRVSKIIKFEQYGRFQNDMMCCDSMGKNVAMRWFMWSSVIYMWCGLSCHSMIWHRMASDDMECFLSIQKKKNPSGDFCECCTYRTWSFLVPLKIPLGKFSILFSDRYLKCKLWFR